MPEITQNVVPVTMPFMVQLTTEQTTRFSRIFTPRALRSYVYEINVRSMNIDDRPTDERPTSGPIYTFSKNFKWP